jgi:hypothetical protein
MTGLATFVTVITLDITSQVPLFMIHLYSGCVAAPTVILGVLKPGSPALPKLDAPTGFDCHWYVKPVPVATTVAVTVPGVHNVTLLGCVVITGLVPFVTLTQLLYTKQAPDITFAR